MMLLAAALVLQTRHAGPGWQRRYRMGDSQDASVRVNGRTLDAPAYIHDNSVLVPMRPIFEALGATLQWFPRTRKVVAHKEGKTISLIVGENFAYTPDPVLMHVRPVMRGDRVFVPLRFVSEALGADVGWNAARRTARVDARG